ncbi:Nop14-like protein [Violaceomyces palustris]|uniref:Nop14-like protein n=1 Tax=Violaceomyces palustris TaxID=1673888 RepID=A0ACD0P7T3_9BASI|nr:Nop14-like protein [Violaceomyces palustris]
MGKGGGSQLNQLKSKLRAAGVTDRRQQSKSSKKRKGGQDEVERAAIRRNKIEAITRGLNPFDEKISKPKHDVLGRKVKGAVGRPGAAKASGLAQRRATLLPEWEARNKAGTFVDRRFGENDANMTPEEKMLERFTAEKQRRAARGGALFNLNDGLDEGLTHYGQSLSGLDDLADIGIPDDEDDDNIDGRTTSRGHFGGFGEEEKDDEDPDRVKTKAEVMREVIAKSKLHKYERQQIKDQDDELRLELDNELKDIRGLLFADMNTTSKEEEEEEEARKAKYGNPAITGTNAVPLGGKGKEKAIEGQEEAEVPAKDPKAALFASSSKTPANSYDAFVRELAFERRAKPQDRLKSEAELAEEEAARLRKAEAARLRRMRGDSDDEDDDEEGAGKRRRKGRDSDRVSKRSKRVRGGDDLDDDFELGGESAADAYGLGQGLGDGADDSEEDEAEEDEDEDEDDEEGESEEDGEDDEDEDDDEDDFADLADVDGLAQPGEDAASGDEEDEEALTGTKAKSSKGKGAASDAKSAIPFTFPCPITHDEFLTLLEENKIEAKDVPTVVKRIRTLHHASLAEDNKHRLQAFLGVLLDHALHCAAIASSGKSSRAGFAVVNSLINHIFSLSKAYPVAASQHFVSKLALMQRNLSRGLAKGPLAPGARTWPGAAELTLLRIAGSIWPTSDKSHPVITPLALLIAQYLGHARIRSLADLTSGLFLCSLVASHEKDSKRIVPEALNFLHNAILILSPFDKAGKSQVKKQAHAFGIPTPDFEAPHTAGLSLGSDSAGLNLDLDKSVDLLSLLSIPADEREDDEAKAKLLSLAFVLTREFAGLYVGGTSFVELITPSVETLVSINDASLPPSLAAKKAEVETTLQRQIKIASSSRRYLRLQAHRAIPIASYVPKFDQQGYNPDRKFDPDSERAQLQKLKALLKKEKKGAIRELRKDNQFLAEEKRKVDEIEEKNYKKKIDKIMAGLQDERSEQKVQERQKARLKKQAGKK